jgi:hypothetical protein
MASWCLQYLVRKSLLTQLTQIWRGEARSGKASEMAVQVLIEVGLDFSRGC